jgi:hypothetical protein
VTVTLGDVMGMGKKDEAPWVTTGLQENGTKRVF